MQSNQVSGKKSGKVPDSPKAEIPQHLYNLLSSFKDDYGVANCKKMLQDMLIQTQFSNGFDGQQYARLTEFVFFSMVFFDFVGEYIPGEFDEAQKNSAA